MTSPYETVLKIGDKRFCAYCGQEILPDENGQFVCQCDDAREARRIELNALNLLFEANKLKNSRPKPRFQLQTVCAPIPNTTQEPQHHECKSSNTVWEHPHEKYPEE